MKIEFSARIKCASYCRQHVYGLQIISSFSRFYTNQKAALLHAAIKQSLPLALSSDGLFIRSMPAIVMQIYILCYVKYV